MGKIDANHPYVNKINKCEIKNLVYLMFINDSFFLIIVQVHGI